MLKPRYETIKEAVSEFKQLLRDLDVRFPKDSFEDEDESVDEATGAEKMAALKSFHQKDPEAVKHALSGGSALMQTLRKKAAAEKAKGSEVTRGAATVSATGKTVSSVAKKSATPPPMPHQRKTPPPIPAGAKKKEPTETQKAIADLPHKKKTPPPIPADAKKKNESLDLGVNVAMEEIKMLAGLIPYEVMPYDPGRQGSVRYIAEHVVEEGYEDEYEDGDETLDEVVSKEKKDIRNKLRLNYHKRRGEVPLHLRDLGSSPSATGSWTTNKLHKGDKEIIRNHQFNVGKDPLNRTPFEKPKAYDYKERTHKRIMKSLKNKSNLPK